MYTWTLGRTNLRRLPHSVHWHDLFHIFQPNPIPSHWLQPYEKGKSVFSRDGGRWIQRLQMGFKSFYPSLNLLMCSGSPPTSANNFSSAYPNREKKSGRQLSDGRGSSTCLCGKPTSNRRRLFLSCHCCPAIHIQRESAAELGGHAQSSWVVAILQVCPPYLSLSNLLFKPSWLVITSCGNEFHHFS